MRALFLLLAVLISLLFQGCATSRPGPINVLKVDDKGLWIVRDGTVVIDGDSHQVKVIYYCFQPQPGAPNPACYTAEYRNGKNTFFYWPRYLRTEQIQPQY